MYRALFLNKAEGRIQPDARFGNSLDEEAESVAIRVLSNQEEGNRGWRPFSPGAFFAATRARSARQGQGGQALNPNAATLSAERRFFAPSHRRQLRQRRCEGGGTAKRRARRSRGRCSLSARVAVRVERANHARRAPEAPAARRFLVPRTACAQDARPPYREVGWWVGSESRNARTEPSRFGRCETQRKREKRKPVQAISEKVLREPLR